MGRRVLQSKTVPVVLKMGLAQHSNLLPQCYKQACQAKVHSSMQSLRRVQIPLVEALPGHS
jgi:hypothetical protein